LAETTYEHMDDLELDQVVKDLEKRLAQMSRGAADGLNRGGSGMSLAEVENELNQARAVLAARKMGQGLP
jgi:hypothetical protein